MFRSSIRKFALQAHTIQNHCQHGRIKTLDIASHRYISSSNFFLSSNQRDEKAKYVKETFEENKTEIIDDCVSPFPSKQLYVTLESAFKEKAKKDYMLYSNDNSNAIKFLNDRFKKGETVPYGYSLIYCTPYSPEYELGSDGFDNYHAPLFPDKEGGDSKTMTELFKRRMWVGGDIEFRNDRPMKFGEPVKLVERIDRVRILGGKKESLSDLTIVLSNNKEYSDLNTGEPIITENRRIFYINETNESSSKDAPKNVKEQPDNSTLANISNITNFRVSALTFNSHKIHYDPSYCKEVENYDDVIVQGPVLFELAVQYWRNNFPDLKIKKITYKIPSSVLVNQDLKVCYRKRDESSYELWIENINNSNSLCFDSTVTLDI
ncbi:hypothetical protein BVG19_g1783 [[Candida] boidinii]|nr:hypothetical protein BVG19_g1783 [[Candida] boidinii]OWB53624.1 hypothetical protein B5S27_g5229 [[Candida] boidinii]